MKKITKTTLLVTCLLGLSGQVFGKDFTASGSEPFWSVTLKPLNGDNYRAVFSYPGETDVVNVRATVSKSIHKHYDNYQGQSDNGKPFSLMAIKKSCTDDGKGDTWSHVVTVSAIGGTFDGCGGVVTQDSEDWSDNNQSNAQPPVNPAREQAKKLNTQGFHLYQQGKYYQALPLFKKATQADKSYVLGQYNLACTAAIVLKNFDCHQDESLLDIANPNTILTALKQSIRLDPKRKAKSQTAPDLALVRKSYRYYRDILGYSPNNDRQLREMLENIEWTQAAGFYAHQGKMARLYFDKDSVTEIDNKGREKSGKYRLNHGEITLTFHSKKYGRQQISGRLVDNDGVFDGVLHFDGAAAAHVLTFDDYTFTFPTPCEAN